MGSMAHRLGQSRVAIRDHTADAHMKAELEDAACFRLTSRERVEDPAVRPTFVEQRLDDLVERVAAVNHDRLVVHFTGERDHFAKHVDLDLARRDITIEVEPDLAHRHHAWMLQRAAYFLIQRWLV
jgi:hypothetical protein